MAAMVVQARPVDEHRARSFVETHFFAPAVCVSPAEWKELYVFVPAEGVGFVVMAADDCVQPVLSYSATSRFPVEQMPVHVKAWIEGYRHDIAARLKHPGPPSSAVRALWQNPKSRKSGQAGPLMTTTWNQSPYYNALCPYDEEEHRRTITGCPATAAAQVMKYWNYPPVGWGSHSYVHQWYGITLEARFDTTHYAWELMPDSLDANIDSAAVMAVAQLMYHAGVAMETGYGTDGSGANVVNRDFGLPHSTESALKTYFRYNPLLHSVHKDEYSDSDWDSLMRHQIDLGQPVIYSAGGHAYVIDGYDSTGLFHANWGWGGLYDGFYALNHLCPGGYTDYSSWASAIIDIRPASVAPDSVAHIQLLSADTTQGTVSGSGAYASLQDTVILEANARDGYVFDHWASGITKTPLVFIASDNHTDTAYFKPISTDTVAYCLDSYFWTWIGEPQHGSEWEWGIRVTADVRDNPCDLTAVQNYCRFDHSSFVLNIYVGDSLTEATCVYSKPLEYNSTGWNTHTLDSALHIDDTSTLWITFYSKYNETNVSRYLGNSDGTWCRLPGGWAPNSRDVYGAWMIRGVFGRSTYPNGTLPVVDNPSLSAVNYRIDSHTLIIDNPKGLNVNLYDISGRRLLSNKDNYSKYHFRSGGVYLLKVENENSRKLIVLK